MKAFTRDFDLDFAKKAGLSSADAETAVRLAGGILALLMHIGIHPRIAEVSLAILFSATKQFPQLAPLVHEAQAAHVANETGASPS